MAPVTASDDQFLFLISCIRNSSNGKVDFDTVAKECNIISKGAAAKRYSRLLKAHGISGIGPGATPKKSAASPNIGDEGNEALSSEDSPTPLSKKRKRGPGKQGPRRRKDSETTNGKKVKFEPEALEGEEENEVTGQQITEKEESSEE